MVFRSICTRSFGAKKIIVQGMHAFGAKKIIVQGMHANSVSPGIGLEVWNGV